MTRRLPWNQGRACFCLHEASWQQGCGSRVLLFRLQKHVVSFAGEALFGHSVPLLHQNAHVRPPKVSCYAAQKRASDGPSAPQSADNLHECACYAALPKSGQKMEKTGGKSGGVTVRACLVTRGKEPCEQGLDGIALYWCHHGASKELPKGLEGAICAPVGCRVGAGMARAR